jgi:hypothetical protein
MKCHSCNLEFSGSVFVPDDDFRASHALNTPHEPCARCSTLHGREIPCKFLPETCGCQTPHIEYLYDASRSDSLSPVQVRAEQRAAIYRMPDGSISVPASNRYDDPIALAAVEAGGIRDEGYHVRDLHRWHKDGKKSDDDEFSDRCLVIDYDQSSIVGQRHFIHQMQQAREDEGRRRVYDRQQTTAPIRVYLGGGRYEEAKRRSGRG